MEKTRKIIRFGLFEFDAASGELRKQGLRIRLADQPLQMLGLLLERPGEVISREMVRQRLWPADTFVDFDAGLNSAIKKLRDALGDPAENSQFVETLPRRGYRFIAPVHPATAEEVSTSLPATAAPALPRARSPWIVGAVPLAVLISAMTVAYQRGWWERPVGTAAGQIRSLAVLPFENLTGDPAQDYFVDGITDALTTDLAQIRGLQVISRTSAMRYRRADKPPLPVIGQELNVDALVEGAIVRSGQHVRITAQLIDAATDRHVWARSYESELSEVVALQRQIATAIAAVLGSRRASRPALAGTPLDIDPDAYDAYLKGVFAGGQQTYQAFRTAVGYFENAIAIQPDFAAAYAGLAQAQHQFVFTGPLSPRESIPKAEAAARKALELDETLAQPHRTLGAILQSYHWQWENGDKEFRRAQELDGNRTDIQSAGAASLIRRGQFEEAIAGAERARKLDPLSFNAYINVATAYRAAGQYDRAIAEIRRALTITPGRPRAHFQLGITFLFMDRFQDAIDELETAVRSSQDGNPRFEAYLGYAYAAAGRRGEALRILHDLESRARQQYVSSFGIALIHDALGQTEPALAALDRAYQDRAVEFSQMPQYPPFRTIGRTPRYETLMRRIGLPR